MLNQLKVSLENIIPLTEARDHFSQIVAEVQKDKLYVLTKGGKPAVAIIDVKYLETISGGEIRPEQVEDEIQKNPEKVGRTPMIKHEAAKPLVFPTPPDMTPTQPASQPIKINFQPDTGAKPTAPASVVPPPTPLEPPTTLPAEQMPSGDSVGTNRQQEPPADRPLGDATPPGPPSSPTPTPTSTTPTAPPPPPTTPISTGTTVDVIPTPDEMSTPVETARVSPDDQPGPAQYAGEDKDEPQDMEI